MGNPSQSQKMQFPCARRMRKKSVSGSHTAWDVFVFVEIYFPQIF